MPRGDGSMHDSASMVRGEERTIFVIDVCPTLLSCVDGWETSGTVTETCMSFEYSFSSQDTF